MHLTGKNKGFTILELMVTISIFFLIVSFSNYGINGWVSKIKLESDMRAVYTQLLKARQLAIINQINYGIKFEPQNDSYILIKEETELEIKKLNEGIKYSRISFGDSNQVTFTPLGTARSGHVKIKNTYSDSYKLIVAPHTGRIRYE